MARRSTKSDERTVDQPGKRGEKGIRVRIVASSEIIEAALELLLRSQGFVVPQGDGGVADVALVDLRDHHAYEASVKEIPSVGMLSDHDDALLILRSGYRGYVRPDDPPGALVRALLAVCQGEIWGERHVLQTLLVEPAPGEPTTREREVMQLLGAGLSNREIAEELGITVSTVKVHVSSLFTKFGVGSRLELIATKFASDSE